MPAKERMGCAMTRCILRRVGWTAAVVLVATGLTVALVGALFVPAQAQTGGAAAPSNLDTESVLYDFCSQGGVYCTDGIKPFAGLIEDASGNLYGTTQGGGSTNSAACNSGSCGYGTVFKLTTSGSVFTKTVLYNFCSQAYCTDGANPAAGVIEDASGNFYGTTVNGGTNLGGTVFRLTPSANGYTESVLYNFCSQGGGACTDGVNPQAGLIEDSSGNLYGTTWLGGTGVTLVNGGYAYGTVFMLAPSGSGYRYSVLYNFCPTTSPGFCLDGAAPLGALIEDASGNLYGTTALGGAGTHALECNGIGCGTVFKLSPNSSGYVETVLHSFCSQGGGNCTDGAYPYDASLIEDASGNFYGTTSAGGVNSCDTPGCGTVFKLTPNGNGSYTESVLHSFDYTDGTSPDAGLIEDASGNLYGTTSNGGAGLSWRCQGCGSGTVFELSPSGSGYTETVLYNFCSQGGEACTDGVMPMAGVIQDASGNLYGTTWEGGNGNDWGTVFKLSPAPPDFSIAASPTSLTVVPGQSGTSTILITPQNGFNSSVSFSCSGLPAGTSCSFSPTPITPSGATASTTLTLTASISAMNQLPNPFQYTPVAGMALTLCFIRRRNRRRCKVWILCAAAALSLVCLTACGRGTSNSGGTTSNPTPESGTVTVTAISGSLSHSAPLTVSVN